MILKLKNIGPFRKDMEVDLSKDTVIEGDNGLGKTTIVDAISIAIYGPFKSGGKDTKRLFEMNEATESSYVELDGVEIGGDTYKIRREILKKGGGKFSQVLYVNGSPENVDFFESIVPLDRYLLMTDYSNFSNLTQDKKSIALNSFFDISNGDIFSSIIRNNLDDFQLIADSTAVKLNQAPEKIDDKYVKKLFATAFPLFGLDKNEVLNMSIEDIKEIALTANKELKRNKDILETTFNKIQSIPKSSLSADNKEDLLKKLNELKDEKEQVFNQVSAVKHYQRLSSIKRVEKSFEDIISFDRKNKKLFVSKFSYLSVTNYLLGDIEKYKEIKKQYVDSLNEFSSKYGEFFNNGAISKLNIEKMDVKSGNIGEIVNSLEIVSDVCKKEISKEKSLLPIMNEFINGGLDVYRDNKKISDVDKGTLVDFIKNRFIDDSSLSTYSDIVMSVKALLALSGKVVSYQEQMNKIYREKLSGLNKDSFSFLSEHSDRIAEAINFYNENKLSYDESSKFKGVIESGTVEKFLSDNKSTLGLNNEQSLTIKLDQINTKEFEVLQKLKNYDLNEKNTNLFIELSAGYKELLKKIESLEIFKELTGSFAQEVLDKNFKELAQTVDDLSGGKICINPDNKRTVEIMIKNNEGKRITYDAMSEGMRIMADNLLMGCIHNLRTKRGQSIGFIAIDEISAVSPHNREILAKSLLSVPVKKIVTITSDKSKLEFNDFNSYFNITSELKSANSLNKESNSASNAESLVINTDGKMKGSIKKSKSSISSI